MKEQKNLIGGRPQRKWAMHSGGDVPITYWVLPATPEQIDGSDIGNYDLYDTYKEAKQQAMDNIKTSIRLLQADLKTIRRQGKPLEQNSPSI